MPVEIAAFIFIIAPIIAGMILCLFSFNQKIVIKIGLIWILLMAVAMFTHMIVVALAALVILMYVRSDPPEVKILYFIAILPALPLNVFLIPFPGINYIWDVNFPRLLSLLLLFPMFFSYLIGLFQKEARFKSIDLWFWVYVLVSLAVAVRTGGTGTAIARSALNFLLEYAVVYFAISQYLRSPQILNWLLSLFILTASFIAFMAFVESLTGWRAYAELLNSLDLQGTESAHVLKQRGGIPRAEGGALSNPLNLAFFSTLAFAAAYFMLQQKQLRLQYGIPLLIVLFMSIFFTGSRAGLLVVIVTIFMFYYLKQNRALKILLGAIGGAFAIFAIVFMFTADLSAIDPEGTFDYRVRLVSAAIDVIIHNPILGSPNYDAEPALQVMRQGEGIIDLVNVFIQVPVTKGLLALIAFVMIFVTLIRDIVSKSNVVGTNHKDLLITLLVVILIYISTTSSFGFLTWYMIVFLAIARAYTTFPEHPVETIPQPTYPKSMSSIDTAMNR